MQNSTRQPALALKNKESFYARCYKKVKKCAVGLCASIFTAFACATTAFAAKEETIKINDVDTETMIGGIISFILQVARYMGFVVVAAGIFMFVFAYKDDNAEAQSRAARFAVVGAILLGLKTILTLTGLID